MKNKYLMVVLVLIGIVVATTSCNKEEPEVIIDGKELPDSEFEFDKNEKYLYTKPYKAYSYNNYVQTNGFINGVDYSGEFKKHQYVYPNGRVEYYSELVKVFSSEEELINSDFVEGYNHYAHGYFDLTKQTYIVVCWIQHNSFSRGLWKDDLKIYKKGDKVSLKFRDVAGGIYPGAQADYLVIVLDEPNLKQGYVRARCE